jgi:rhamnose transport system permease protein
VNATPAARSRFSAAELTGVVFRLREVGIFAALLICIVIFAVRAENFLTVGNWQDIGTDVAMVAVVAVGETMVVLTRNIDLSVGSIVGLTAYVGANTMQHHHHYPIIVIALIAALVGAVCGLGNGLLVAYGKIPAIIATLATLAIYRGIDFELTNGENVLSANLPANFLNLSSESPLGIPSLAWIAIGIAIAGAAILRWLPWARDFYAIGSNPDAAHNTGIPVARRLIAAFLLSGTLAGVGGFMFAARFGGVDATSGNAFEFMVVTAVVIGGVNVFGGSGSVLGAMLGALLVATIDNGFTLLRFSEFWKIFFEGAAIVVAVTVDALLNKRLQELLRRRRRPELTTLVELDAKAGGTS